MDVVESRRRHRRSSAAEEPSLTVVPFTHFPQYLSKVQNGFRSQQFRKRKRKKWTSFWVTKTVTVQVQLKHKITSAFWLTLSSSPVTFPNYNHFTSNSYLFCFSTFLQLECFFFLN